MYVKRRVCAMTVTPDKELLNNVTIALPANESETSIDLRAGRSSEETMSGATRKHENNMAGNVPKACSDGLMNWAGITALINATGRRIATFGYSFAMLS